MSLVQPSIILARNLDGKSALLSQCDAYRYWLMRHIGAGPRRVLFVMLNPSTADAESDDPTIRRCIAFARQMGAARLGVVNLFALRSSKPAALKTHACPSGLLNDDITTRAFEWADMAIAAWGASPASPMRFAALHAARVTTVRRLAQLHCKAPLQALATTASGDPRHPLYLRGDCVPSAWSAQCT